MTKDGLFKLLDFAPCGAYAMSVDQTIIFWNRGARRMLGFEPADVLGRKCFQVTAGLTVNGVTPVCRDGCPSVRYLRAGLVPAPARLHMLCSSGERKWITVIPMVVTGILSDGPLLVHLLDDRTDRETVDQFSGSVRDALVAGGADILPEHPEAPAAVDARPALTPREVEVLQMMALGWETPRIADELSISLHTVRNHIRNLRHKLGVTNKLDAVMAGMRLGILPLG